MPELFNKLKSEFPSLSDDDAVKATTEVASVAPQLAADYAPVEPVFEPEPSGLSPVATPKPIEVDNQQPNGRAMIASLLDPSNLEAMRNGQEPSGDNWFQKGEWMKYFPRLQGAYSMKVKERMAKDAAAQNAVTQRLTAAKNLMDYDISDRTTSVSEADNQRKQIAFDAEMDMRKNPASRELYLQQLINSNPSVWGKRQNQLLFRSFEPHEAAAYVASMEKRDLNQQGFDQSIAGNRSAERIKQMELDAAKEKSGGLDLTPGRLKADQDFATDYNEWNNYGGYSTAVSDINKLKESVLSQLDPKDTSNHRLSGLAQKMPGAGEIVDPRRAAIRDNFRSVMQKSMKPILGAQFAATEGEKMIETGYNPQLSDAENYKRISALVDELSRKAQAKDLASKHYEQFGTISNLKSSELRPPDPANTTHPTKPKTVVQGGFTYTLNEQTGQYE